MPGSFHLKKKVIRNVLTYFTWIDVHLNTSSHPPPCCKGRCGAIPIPQMKINWGRESLYGSPGSPRVLFFPLCQNFQISSRRQWGTLSFGAPVSTQVLGARADDNRCFWPWTGLLIKFFKDQDHKILKRRFQSDIDQLASCSLLPRI